MIDFTTAIIGIVSGVLASVATTSLTRWMERRNQDRFTVQKYARPIWLACEHLAFRLEQIIEKLTDPHGDAANVLDWWRDYEESKKVLWMNGQGYFITSTAYVLSSLSCWFYIVEKKVVFLPFRDRSKSSEFFLLVNRVKRSLTTNTPLWFHYLSGSGQMLLDEDGEQPISYGQFVLRMGNQNEFSDYYQQLFNGFIQEAGQGKITKALEESIESLRAVQTFLHAHATLPIRTMEEATA
jgi:hypothetical protein